MQQQTDYVNQNVPNLDMKHGLMSLIEGRTNAGHLGQSILMGKDDIIWIGEPMSEQGKCLKTAYVLYIFNIVLYRKWSSLSMVV
jgi:hypothetical protein